MFKEQSRSPLVWSTVRKPREAEHVLGERASCRSPQESHVGHSKDYEFSSECDGHASGPSDTADVSFKRSTLSVV